MINLLIGGTLIQISEMVQTSFGGYAKLSNGTIWVINHGRGTLTPYKTIPVFDVDTVAIYQ